ncbi:GPW/gp25 family protein [Ramlibacter sp. USB13]|uniref:GPW/gp25 family protein n=1 Tax=Ramlibacter cellulosilyticus TaxID=2764187 RepID=A0A923SBQ9_9BURK|nr:GPW/gp25 family protein [Ramlibacter cellulosilyticus]MBC5783433.1 GPW/gp25 family protein [Ramlibacter cellulosilyticus]
MEASRVYGQGMGFPPRVQPDGRIAWSAGEDNIRESMRVVLMTEPGERLRLPRFGAGLGRFLFEPNIVATHAQIAERIKDALAQWEPRVRVQGVDVAADRDDPHACIATITYRLVATQALERVSLAVPVASGGSA